MEYPLSACKLPLAASAHQSSSYCAFAFLYSLTEISLEMAHIRLRSTHRPLPVALGEDLLAVRASGVIVVGLVVGSAVATLAEV